MHGGMFNRLAGALSALLSRRGLIAFSTIVVCTSRPARAAGQLQPPSCGVEGGACTQLLGCCDGLVCATSYVNTSYGICVPGEGEMLPVSPTLVTPGSAAMVTAVAADLAELASVETVDLHAERAAVLAARRDKRDARVNRKRTKRKERRQRRRTRRAGG